MTGAAPPRAAKFWSGFAAGVAASAAAVHTAFMAFAGEDTRRAVAEFKDVALPAVAQLALNPAWGWGVPIVTVVAAVAIGRAREEKLRLSLYVALGILAIAAFALTVYGMTLPFRAMAQQIRSD